MTTSFESIDRALDRLYTKYPRCFVRTDVKPVKVGILHDLIKDNPDIAHDALRLALGTYCGSAAYGATLRQGRYRIDLNGFNVGMVGSRNTEPAEARAATG